MAANNPSPVVGSGPTRTPLSVLQILLIALILGLLVGITAGLISLLA